MTFEQSLRHELVQINQLTNKVFPIYAKEGTKGPFLVYKRKILTFRKTLNGTSNKAIGEYHLVIVTTDYAQLQELSDLVKDKLLSFWNREIGVNGPYIDDVTIEFGEDDFADESNFIATTIKLKVEF